MWDKRIHLLAFWQFQPRAWGQRIIGYFSTMRMTIYLLDGCSADYVIIKNNFHPLLCIGVISDSFLFGLQETPSPDDEKWGSGRGCVPDKGKRHIRTSFVICVLVLLFDSVKITLQCINQTHCLFSWKTVLFAIVPSIWPLYRIELPALFIPLPISFL